MTPEPPPLRRITHVTEAPLGGVVTYLQELLTHQVENLHAAQIDIITPDINLPAFQDLAGRGVRIIPFRHRRGSVAALILMGWKTLRHVRRTKPDIVHLHSTFAGAVIRCFVPFMPRQTKIIYCAHGWAFSRDSSPRVKRTIQIVEKTLARLTDKIICISDYERGQAEAIGIPAQRLIVIENGISAKPAAPPRITPDNGPKRIVFAGRFDRQKGYDTFLEVMRQLEDEAEGIAIGSAIVSNGALPEPPKNVQILGWQKRDKVFELFAQSDLLLVPSRWEGFGLVAIEAMQARLAVFASRVGGLQDIVVDNHTGRLFSPQDVDQIVKLIKDTTSCQLTQLGMNGYARYESRYTLDRMAQQVSGLYQTVLQKR